MGTNGVLDKCGKGYFAGEIGAFLYDLFKGGSGTITKAGVRQAAKNAAKRKTRKAIRDYATERTEQKSAHYESEGAARATAREKLGTDPVEIEPGKWRSQDGKWQYRAYPGDVSRNHVHLEELNPRTGEVLQNWHLRWP
jgi:hypothetical protein